MLRKGEYSIQSIYKRRNIATTKTTTTTTTTTTNSVVTLSLLLPVEHHCPCLNSKFLFETFLQLC